jgi:hypothetical protein
MGTTGESSVQRMGRVTAGPPGSPFAMPFGTVMYQSARMAVLDAVTTEVVRLRCARTHNCRFCKSLLTVSALDGGADEALYAKIDRFESSDLDERLKVALRLTDAVITRPTAIGPELRAQVQLHFSPAEVVEMLTDIMRNSSQKMAVALDADQANVGSGVEYYDVLPTGDVVFHHRYSEPQPER